MNQVGDAQPWSQPDLHQMDQEFSNFLDLGVDFESIDFTISEAVVDHAQNGQQHNGEIQSLHDDPNHLQHHASHPSSQFVSVAEQSSQTSADVFNFAYNTQFQQHPPQPPTHPSQHAFGFQQQQQQQQQHDGQYRPHQIVPPTPNSVEMHGDPSRYLQQYGDAHARALMEQQFKQQQEMVGTAHLAKSFAFRLTVHEQATYTPLVSPAQTPHDARFNLQQEFTVPGAYFSPLTSPAIEAQRAYQRSAGNRSGDSAGTSPIDIDVDMLGDPAVPGAAKNQRLKKKTSAVRSSGASTKVKQSPIARARRKAGSITIPTKEVSDVLEQARRSAGTFSLTIAQSLRPSHDNSSVESISPEPLSESVMGPPPKPASALQSPAIAAQHALQQQ
ncbi:hypothetical protein LTS18_004569, partial [Coniosporium uncinatum]